MAHGKDYIPARDADFDHLFKRIVDYVNEKTAGNPPAWTDIPQQTLAALNTHYNKWHMAYYKVLAEHTSADVGEKQRVRTEAEHNLRDFVQRYLKYAPVSDYDRDQMGIPNDDHVKTTIVRPLDHIRLRIEPTHTKEHTVSWEIEETGSKARPYGCDGVVLAHRVLEADEPEPKDASELGSGQLLTKNNYVQHFHPKDQGKRCAYAGCLQNERGEKGEWSDIIIVFIA